MTSEAKVNLAAIHYHFGSKAGLFHAVVRRRLLPLARERLRRLDEAERAAAPGALRLEDVIEAFVRPVMDVLLEGELGAAWIRIIGWSRVEPGGHWDCLTDEFAETYRRFRAAFRAALSDVDLPEDELSYRLFFFLGMEANTVTDVHGLRAIDPSLPTVFEDPDGVVSRLVHFASAGLRAPVPSPTRDRTGDAR